MKQLHVLQILFIVSEKELYLWDKIEVFVLPAIFIPLITANSGSGF